LSKVVIGTRGSELALWQANTVAGLLGEESELKIIKTAGDRFLGQSLQGQFEQGFFTKELEEQLLAGEIDVAAHSLKDLPTQSPKGLAVGAYLKRAPVSDLLIVNPEWHAPSRPVPVREGTPVGATSLRRQAQLKLYAPHAQATFLRGNVPTRVRKCAEGEYGAIILARAGVGRLGLDLSGLHCYEFDPQTWLPAPGQGAIAVQARANDSRIRELLARLDDEPTRIAASLERAVLANYQGGCHTAFGAWARPEGGQWRMGIGIEDVHGWRQTEVVGEPHDLQRIGPHSGLAFALPKTGELCRPCQL
jgi:hydroxymethylbilane synthase